ncbi:MAG TPA: dihydrolipoamide acetyltransferase family protein [Paenalcaligenes sp.]|nr:dihydrolipoamide acetyltransferase family protein [Paenalcaligenes sp.]
MSNYVIKIPDIGEGIAEVELVRWLVRVGDWVEADQNVASVMTDKVSVDISSPVSGRVQQLDGEAGDILRVGADLIQIALGEEGETSNKADEAIHAETLPAIEETPEPAATVDAHTPLENDNVAFLHPDHDELVKGVLASPTVRKRVADLGLSLAEVARALQLSQLSHGDLDRYLVQQNQVLQQGGQHQSMDSSTAERGGMTKRSVRGMRRQIAQKMERSSQQIPHFTYVESVDVTELERLRATLNNKYVNQRAHLTLLPFLVKGLCLALNEHPRLNAVFDEENYELHEYEDINVGIATQTEQGLMVPVIHAAQYLDIWDCAAAIVTLSQAAKQGTLKHQQATGSTISLSSLGALGGVVATPIINYPEVAVIGVNKIVELPCVQGDAIVIRKTMNLSSSFDHRIVDGYDAAAFIQTLRTYIEQPALLFAA